jgi:hypothetical protein
VFRRFNLIRLTSTLHGAFNISIVLHHVQASVKEAGIDKLPPPITPDNNPHTVPGQFDLNGNDQRGHIIAAGVFQNCEMLSH